MTVMKKKELTFGKKLEILERAWSKYKIGGFELDKRVKVISVIQMHQASLLKEYSKLPNKEKKLYKFRIDTLKEWLEFAHYILEGEE
jgi:hypothetical protein